MAKWRITKETKDIFRWKAVTPDGQGAIRTVTFEMAIKTIYELAKEE